MRADKMRKKVKDVFTDMTAEYEKALQARLFEATTASSPPGSMSRVVGGLCSKALRAALRRVSCKLQLLQDAKKPSGVLDCCVDVLEDYGKAISDIAGLLNIHGIQLGKSCLKLSYKITSSHDQSVSVLKSAADAMQVAHNFLC